MQTSLANLTVLDGRRGMHCRTRRAAAQMVVVLLVLWIPCRVVVGQPPNEEVAAGTQATATGPTTQAARRPLAARVIEVVGEVRHAPLGSQEWQAVKLGDAYPEGTKILTGLRSSVKFQIGEEEPYTCLLVDSASLTILGEAAIERQTKEVRVGVSYGRIRAGVAEGGLESEFTVDSPVATLSKRGTWGFSLYYERGTDVFEIALTDRGLIEAIRRVGRQRRTLSPRERVTQAMRMWLDQSQLDRNVSIADLLGQEDILVAFNRLQNDGLGVVTPGSGRSMIIDLRSQGARAAFAHRLQQSLGSLPARGIGVPSRIRPEGFFGTGRGDELVDVLIQANEALALKGFVRPGHYRFRRAALENWLRRNQPD